ncbi:M23 family metallopeptidase [Sorangium sp. So ce388]|uniref:M23 family metallopeptidase n=1 Tax=Sorangium sp. So ce388 TaxID=3133309 RepID=UPI003F5B6F48
MKNRYSLGLCSVALAVLSAPLGCAVTPDDALGAEEELVESTSQAITVSGLKHYCSGTWPGLGGWAFTSGTADPCASITSTGGTVKRKGLYSASGVNRVVYRCNPPSYGWVGQYQGTGDAPLAAAYDAADGKSECIFTVSPVSLPIFDAPFSLSTTYSHATGFDFAKAPYDTLNVADFGQTGSTAATVVDWMGRDKSTGFMNGHDGHDWFMARGTPIRAVADGVVVMARDWPSGATGSDSPDQKEVAIEHTVRGTAGSTYAERFVTYYAHFQSYSVEVGDVVSKGEQIGLSGNTGTSSGPHLHFSVIRKTNTANELSETISWFLPPAGHSNSADNTIEPYGWAAPEGFDPWSWRGYPDGALSVALWNSGQAPSTGTW